MSELWSTPDPKPEPIWVGLLKITGIILGGAAVLGLIVWGIISLGNYAMKVDAERKAEEALHTKPVVTNLVCKVERVFSPEGWEQFTKITFEGHTYITYSQRSFLHLESCPCHTKKAEKE